MDWISAHVAVVVAAAICAVCLLVLGMRDLRRFSLVRIRAVASVVFIQAVRRRVLWLSPLVIAGVVIVSQLSHPADAENEIHQATRYCLFATGLLVSVVTIILACTNIPREIETRVIYTVATKPTTRLEIVLGKIVGFAQVSGALLLLMGLLSYGYLLLRDHQMRSAIAGALGADPNPEAVGRATLERYRDEGLLHARKYQLPESQVLPNGEVNFRDIDVYSSPPTTSNGRWMAGGGEGVAATAIENFAGKIRRRDRSKRPPGLSDPNIDITFRATVVMRRVGSQPAAPATAPASTAPAPASTAPAPGPAPWAPGATPARVPSVFDMRKSSAAVVAAEFNIFDDENRLAIPKNAFIPANGFPLQEGSNDCVLTFPAALADGFDSSKTLFISCNGSLAGYEYSLVRGSVEVVIPPEAAESREPVVVKAVDKVDYRGRFRRGAQQIVGRTPLHPLEQRLNANTPTAVYSFNFDASELPSTEQTQFEFESTIDRSGADLDVVRADPTILVFAVVNSKFPSQPAFAIAKPESSRRAFFTVPTGVLKGGQVDVWVQCNNSGHYLLLRTGPNSSLKLVLSEEPFALNLAKSLFVMWLFFILVAAAAVFCSTFVSWPIAVVMTLLILFGHWAVAQIGDLTDPGSSRRVIADIFGRHASAAQATTLTQSLEVATKALTTMSNFLPDISTFASMEHIEAGAAMPPSVLLQSLLTLLGFGATFASMTYAILRFKEVAP